RRRYVYVAVFYAGILLYLRCCVPLRLWFLHTVLLRPARLRILPFTTCANGYATYRTLTSATHGGYFHAVIGTFALDLRLSALQCSVLHARRGLRGRRIFCDIARLRSPTHCTATSTSYGFYLRTLFLTAR